VNGFVQDKTQLKIQQLSNSFNLLITTGIHCK